MAKQAALWQLLCGGDLPEASQPGGGGSAGGGGGPGELVLSDEALAEEEALGSLYADHFSVDPSGLLNPTP